MRRLATLSLEERIEHAMKQVAADQESRKVAAKNQRPKWRPITIAEVLAFENVTYQSPGAKDDLISRTFGLSRVHYYQHLNRILSDPDALAADPILVRRLIGVRDRNVAARRLRVFPNQLTSTEGQS